MRQRLSKYILALLLVLSLIPIDVNALLDQSLNEAFLKAVRYKDVALMNELLQQGADINGADDTGVTPLIFAVSAGDIKTVNFLIAKGADFEETKPFTNAPIYFAISENKPEIVSRLLDLGVSPNFAWPNRDEGTLLITAVQCGHLEMVKLLVRRGANVNCCGNGDFSPLYRSVIYDRFSIFKFLLSKGAYLNRRDKTALSELKWDKVEKDRKYIEYLKKRGSGKKMVRP